MDACYGEWQYINDCTISLLLSTISRKEVAANLIWKRPLLHLLILIWNAKPNHYKLFSLHWRRSGAPLQFFCQAKPRGVLCVRAYRIFLLSLTDLWYLAGFPSSCLTFWKLNYCTKESTNLHVKKRIECRHSKGGTIFPSFKIVPSLQFRKWVVQRLAAIVQEPMM